MIAKPKVLGMKDVGIDLRSNDLAQLGSSCLFEKIIPHKVDKLQTY